MRGGRYVIVIVRMMMNYHGSGNVMVVATGGSSNAAGAHNCRLVTLQTEIRRLHVYNEKRSASEKPEQKSSFRSLFSVRSKIISVRLRASL